MKITLNPLDPRSIDNAIKQINQYQATFQNKVMILCEKLAEIGLEVAEPLFEGARYDGNNDVTVQIEKSESGYRLVARGSAVAFIEFGTGIKENPSGNASYLGQRPEGIVGIGEYGKGHGATGKKWYYAHNTYTYGNPPAMAMYYAEAEMLKEVMNIARSVFND